MGLAGCVAAALGYDVTFADIEAPALLFAELNALPFPSTRCRRTNWQKDQLGQTFDLILGADILYEQAQWESIESFCRHHLAPHGTLILGEPGRPTGEPFADWMRGQGWMLEEHQQKVEARHLPIRLLLFRRI